MGGRRIKLIWDFRGPDSAKTAEHHEKHLQEFARAEKMDPIETGYTTHGEFHTIAFLVVPEANMIQVRDALLPHRGEYVITGDNEQ